MKLILKTESLKELLTDFYVLTEMRIVIFDSEFNEVMAYPLNPTDFCAIIKSDSKARRLCEESDKRACTICSREGKIHIYECHAGLTEVVAPIKMDGLIVGYIMFGQLICGESKTKARAGAEQRLTAMFEDTTKLMEGFDKLILKRPEQIRAASKILESCACYLWISELMAVDNCDFIHKITNYITNNLNSDLSVEFLCNYFRVSRSRLYEMSHKYLGMSIAKFVRKKRMIYAAKMLKEQKCAISYAAENSGFSDYNYFSKAFKCEMGVLPKDYRKQ